MEITIYYRLKNVKESTRIDLKINTETDLKTLLEISKKFLEIEQSILENQTPKEKLTSTGT